MFISVMKFVHIFIKITTVLVKSAKNLEYPFVLASYFLITSLKDLMNVNFILAIFGIL